MEEVETGLKAGANPRDAKLALAEEVVALYYGHNEAVRAREAFIATFQKKEIPDDIEEIKMIKNETFAEIMVRGEVASSKSDWRRLVDEGAAKHLGEGGVEEKITNHLELAAPGTYKIGKRRFIKIV
jgi:tyrosyl-tRNA synthetase